MHPIRYFLLMVAVMSLAVWCSCAISLETTNGLVHALPGELPINYEARRFGLILLPVRIGDGEEMLFAMETGGPFTLLDRSLEPKLGKPLRRGKVQSVYGVLSGRYYPAPTLRLNNTPLQTGPKVMTTDLTRLSEDLSRITHTNHRIMGLLGMDCLEHYCIQMDFTNREMRFLNPDHLQSEKLGKAFPLIILSGGVFVGENLLGMKGQRTQVDTGCTFDGELKTKIFKRWTNRNVLVNGTTIQPVYPNGVFGGDTYPDLHVTGDGNRNTVGLRFLARHLVTFDFPGRLMYLKRTTTEPLAANNNGRALAR